MSDLSIYTVRGEAVVLANDVAPLFGLETRNVTQQIKRNIDRFEDGFAFQMTNEEWSDLRSQNEISSHGGTRYPPWCLTEHGVVMVATLLKSAEAVQASRLIVRTFVEARRKTPKGQNLPALLDPDKLLPVEASARAGLVAKLDGALGRVLDAIADPEENTTVREEARALAKGGLDAVKSRLERQGIDNEKTLAEIHKLLREAEVLDAEIEAKAIENEHRRLAYLAKQLRIVIELQRFIEKGDTAGLLSVLEDLSR